MHFIFVYDGLEGDVYASSVAQAVDRIKVEYLARKGITPKDPRFRLYKSKLIQPRRLNLAPTEDAKFRSLYRQAREDSLSQADQVFMDAYRTAQQDINAICAPHLRPIRH